MRIGESYYAYPDLPTIFATSFMNNQGEVEAAVPDGNAYALHECWSYVPSAPILEQGIYGIGVVVNNRTRDTGWGVALYRKNAGDTLECMAIQPVTQHTPHRHFLFTSFNVCFSSETQSYYLDTIHPVNTVYKLYDVFLDYPRWATDSVFFGVYDNYQHHSDNIYYWESAPIINYGALFSQIDSTCATTIDNMQVSDTTCGNPVLQHYYLIDNRYHGIFPIIAPPNIDSVPSDCAAVASWLSLVRQSGDTAVLQWGTTGMPYMCQLAWGKNTLGGDSLHSLTTTAHDATLTGLDTGWYSCAVRAACRHQCYFHDTLLYGAWSDTLLFYVSPRADTTGTGGDTTGTGGDTTAIFLVENAASLLLSPNPTDGRVTLSSPYPLRSLAVTDPQGRTVLHQQANGLSYSFNVSHWPKGLYLLRARTVRGTFAAKLIVQ